MQAKTASPIFYQTEDVKKGLAPYLSQLSEAHQIGQLGIQVLRPADKNSTSLQFSEDLLWGNVLGRLHTINSSLNDRLPEKIPVNGLYEISNPDLKIPKR